MKKNQSLNFWMTLLSGALFYVDRIEVRYRIHMYQRVYVSICSMNNVKDWRATK